jgi:hypothetical protein
MRAPSPSTRVFLGLVAILGALTAVAVYLPPFPGMETDTGSTLPRPIQALINGGVIVLVYGALGYLGLRLSRRLGFADILDKNVGRRQRFVYPALIGIGLGVFMVAADSVFARFHDLGSLPGICQRSRSCSRSIRSPSYHPCYWSRSSSSTGSSPCSPPGACGGAACWQPWACTSGATW